MQKCAIIHVENTENVLELAKYLVSAGWTILTANKTEDLLKREKIPVTHESSIAEYNQYAADTSQLIHKILYTKPEQPYNYDDSKSEENNIFLICMNIIPEITIPTATKPLPTIINPGNFVVSSIIRASYANHSNVLVLSDPADYKEAMIQLKTDNIKKEFRTYLAAKALNMVSAYDAGLAASILQSPEYGVTFMNNLTYPYRKDTALHQGTNAQQTGYLYKTPDGNGALNGFLKLQGKDLTFTIVSDISYAWERVSTLYELLKNQYSVKSTNCDGYDFTTQFTPLTGTVFTIAVKFNAIVGAALSTNVLDSYKLTNQYDIQNITEIVLACSAVIDDVAAAEMVKGNYVAIIAPGFTAEAKQILSANKNIRLIPSAKISRSPYDGKLITGGLLLQTRDTSLFEHWQVRTKNRPSQFKTDEMAFGMLLAMGAHSYSAILIKNNAIVGIAQGCTSVNRAMMVVYQDALLHKERTQSENSDLDNSLGDVLICDSTIPFDEPVKRLLDNGITAIIQTGGTPADNEFTNYCDERGIVMVFTGMTHISF